MEDTSNASKTSHLHLEGDGIAHDGSEVWVGCYDSQGLENKVEKQFCDFSRKLLSSPSFTNLTRVVGETYG